MKTLIIYYSENGTTKLISETIAKSLSCYICEIKDLKKRNGIMNKLSSTIDAYRETKTKIYPSSLNLSEFDIIYFGTPTWVNNPTPAINTIIDNCNLVGKDIVLFSVDSENEIALDKMESKVKARGGRVIERFTLKTKNKSETQIILDTESLIQVLDLNLYK
ncbi:MAG: flavodoxin [archaeon]|nr:flavodoxin [archaeon]